MKRKTGKRAQASTTRRVNSTRSEPFGTTEPQWQAFWEGIQRKAIAVARDKDSALGLMLLAAKVAEYDRHFAQNLLALLRGAQKQHTSTRTLLRRITQKPAMHEAARRVASLLLTCAFATAHGADFDGRVVNVHDGDTVTVVATVNVQHRVRLADIDAPELHQPFGRRSRESLAHLCAGKQAHVIDRGRDRYGRIIGAITCANVDANAEQVRRGMAWVFVRYARSDSPLYGIEAQARTTAAGLWADPRPVPPWEWRTAQHSR